MNFVLFMKYLRFQLILIHIFEMFNAIWLKISIIEISFLSFS